MKIINNTKYYTITEVGQIIGVTRATILRWYEFEASKPSNYIKMLPEPLIWGGNNARLFSDIDIDSIKKFRDNISQGDMVAISNKYSGVNKKAK